MSTASLRAAAHYGMTEGRRFRLTASCSNGEGDLLSPAPEDLAALTVEAAAMVRAPLAGTNWVPGRVLRMTSAESPAPRPNDALLSILADAYRPCPNFGICREAVWNPEKGHAPRGYLGATGQLKSVEVIMVFAEPGHVHGVERYDPASPPKDLAMQTVEYTYQCFKHGKDLFHRNARWFMDQIWPDISFDHQLEKVWLTESRLCSISDEIGHFRDHHCAATYLVKQIELMPDASVIAFGGKSQKNIMKVVPSMIGAFALSPPGANQKRARPSWEVAISEVLSRRTH